jgi:broad specificity phosphatase PhoE
VRDPGPQVVLLRHGEVASHRGDVPITDAGRRQAEDAGRRLGGRGWGRVLLLSGATRRAQETAAGVRDGLAAGSSVTGPEVAFALRNPDLYLAGHRVDMVSSTDAFAAQVPGLEPEDVQQVPFFAGFLTAPDRIEYWLRSAGPPGDTAADVAGRIVTFARSLGDRGPAGPDAVVCVTHSPVLRAVAVGLSGEDPGEPAYLTGYAVDVTPDGGVSARVFDPFA